MVLADKRFQGAECCFFHFRFLWSGVCRFDMTNLTHQYTDVNGFVYSYYNGLVERNIISWLFYEHSRHFVSSVFVKNVK
jgi:hypothetical protein